MTNKNKKIIYNILFFISLLFIPMGYGLFGYFNFTGLVITILGWIGIIYFAIKSYE